MKKQLLFIIAMTIIAQSSIFAQEYVLRFDNSEENQSIKYSDDVVSSIMDGATDYTIEMWVKPTEDIASNDVFLSMRNTFRLTYYFNHRFYFTHKDNSSGTVTSLFFNTQEEVMTIGAWNHIAVICDSSDGAGGSLKLYVNGVDVTEGENDAIPLVGNEDNNDVFVSYGGGDYSNMYARKVRVLKRAVPIEELHTDLYDDDYVSDDDTAILLNFTEGEGLTTLNEASGVDAAFGYGGSHYPTWVLLADTVIGTTELNVSNFSVYPNPNSNGVFYIESEDTIQNISISNLLGEIIFSKSFDSEMTSVNIDSGLTSGIYLVNITTKLGTLSRKAVVQ